MRRLLDALAASADACRNRNLLRLELGWLGAITGEFAYAVAISVYAYRADGATAVGLVWLIRMIPAAVAAPFLSMLGDRYRRERVMLVGNAVRFVATALSALAVWLDAPATSVYALSVVVAIVSTAFWPAQAALLPALARTPRELTAANTASSTLEGLGSFAGPAAIGALLALTSIELAFTATALTFLWAAALVARIEAPGIDRAALGGFRRVIGETLAGFRTVAANGRVGLLVGVYAAWAVVSGALNVLVVVAAIELLDIGEGGVGVLNASIGIGGVVGALATFALASSGRFGFILAVGMVVWSIPIALVGIWPNPVVATALLAAVGLGNILMDVAGLTLLQRVVPDDVLTRVLGLIEGLWVGAIGIGAAAIPPLIALVDLRGALIVTGLVLPLFALATRAALRSIDDEIAAPAEAVDLLRRIPLFSPLSPAAMERLAASLDALRFEAGDEIIRQGESGDRFYVLTEGSVEVQTDGGRSVGIFGPGYFFGEIALLRDLPRTATVRAVTAARVQALDRAEFLATVTGYAPSAAAAEDVVRARLAGLGRLALRRV